VKPGTGRRPQTRGIGYSALAALAAAGTVWLGACRGERIQGPAETESPVFVVSNPVVAAPAAAAGAGFSLAGSTGDGLAYVSLPPGTIPGGAAATIRNRRLASTQGTILVAGGFDPVGVPAAAGDTLELDVRGADGGTLLLATAMVPAARPPIIVRIDPAPRRRDVPLNATMVIVFSEPIAAATVTASSVRLLVGPQTVNATPELSSDGLRVELRPEAPLADSTEYTLLISTAIADLSGDRLEQPFTLQFTTRAATRDDPVDPVEVSRIAFANTDGTNLSGIFVMKADGSDVTALGEGGGPAWSPDGTRIAFAAQRHCTAGTPDPCVRQIYVMNADGSGVTRVTNLVAPPGSIDAGAAGPAWSPSGTELAFLFVAYYPEDEYGAYHFGVSEILRVDLDGSNLVRLTSAGWFGEPRWSDDGRKIAFRTASGFSVVDRNGANLVPLVDGPPYTHHPDRSPDGTRIVLSRAQYVGGTEDGRWVTTWFIRKADGSEILLVAPDDSSMSSTSSRNGWSPDGTRMAFVRHGPGGRNGVLYTINTDGTQERILVRGDLLSSPAWSLGAVPSVSSLSAKPRR
jgi:Tol biopolymer transport system component